MGTHGFTIQFEDGSRAYIDGVPDKCDHKESDDVFQSASGKMIFWYTYRQWAHLNSKMRYELIMDYHNKIEDPIVMGTTQCRFCKQIDYPNGLDYV